MIIIGSVILRNGEKMLINDELIFYIEEKIPLIEYGERGNTEWLSFENIYLIISDRKNEVIEQMIENLQMIKKQLKERNEAFTND